MRHAYDEDYIDDAMNNLGDMFDYAVNDLGFDPDKFMSYFIVSGVARSFERGNPKYIAGLSGPELAMEVHYRTFTTRIDVRPSENFDKSPEYWAGWILAYYQWYTSRRFSDLVKNGLSMTKILSLYDALHEADVSKFVSIADKIYQEQRAQKGTKLQQIRKASGMTQEKLAERSGVSKRMIQLYEQRQQDINKAQAISLNHLARTLGCEMEDLLEI